MVSLSSFLVLPFSLYSVKKSWTCDSEHIFQASSLLSLTLLPISFTFTPFSSLFCDYFTLE
jgi:hypothetical protein